MSGDIRAVVECGVYSLVACPVGDTLGISHLHYIYFTTGRPLLLIVAHHPKCGPQTICGLRQFYTCFNLSILEILLVLGVHATGHHLVAGALGCKN